MDVAKRLTAGVTGKGGTWRTKPPDAESAFWGRFPESVGDSPHLSGARGVGRGFTGKQNAFPIYKRFTLNLDTVEIFFE